MDFWSQPLEYWRSGGPLLVPIALVCFAIWAYFFRTRRLLMDASHIPPDLNKTLMQAFPERTRSNIDKAIQTYTSKAWPVAGGIVAVLNATSAGKKAGEAFDEWQTHALRILNRDIVILAALTTMAPLLGLLGTVIGMVQTFDAVADTSGDTATRVASGISQALITTQFGLIVAIPGVFGLARLHRALDHVRVAFAQCRTHILLALEHPHTKPGIL